MAQTFKLDINPIFKGDMTEKSFSFEFMPEYLDESIVFDACVKVEGRVYEKAGAKGNSDNLVMAEFRLLGSYTALCARCLEPVPSQLDYFAEYAVATETQNQDDSAVMLAPLGILDVGDAADALFFMNFPSKHLCKDDCKGLCQGCGCNLNSEKCSCSTKNIDPRLAVLKKLLDK